MPPVAALLCLRKVEDGVCGLSQSQLQSKGTQPEVTEAGAETGEGALHQSPMALSALSKKKKKFKYALPWVTGFPRNRGHRENMGYVEIDGRIGSKSEFPES